MIDTSMLHSIARCPWPLTSRFLLSLLSTAF